MATAAFFESQENRLGLSVVLGLCERSKVWKFEVERWNRGKQASCDLRQNDICTNHQISGASDCQPAGGCESKPATQSAMCTKRSFQSFHLHSRLHHHFDTPFCLALKRLSCRCSNRLLVLSQDCFTQEPLKNLLAYELSKKHVESHPFFGHLEQLWLNSDLRS